MIEPITDPLIRELLKHGISLVKIAKQLSISRNTVSRIVHVMISNQHSPRIRPMNNTLQRLKNCSSCVRDLSEE